MHLIRRRDFKREQRAIASNSGEKVNTMNTGAISILLTYVSGISKILVQESKKKKNQKIGKCIIM